MLHNQTLCSQNIANKKDVGERPPSGYCPQGTGMGSRLLLYPVYLSGRIFMHPQKNHISFPLPLGFHEGSTLGVSSSLDLFVFPITHYCAQHGSPAVPTSGQLFTAWVCLARPLLADIHVVSNISSLQTVLQ